MNEVSKIKKKKPRLDRGDIIFYCIFMAWPVLQFCVYYIGVNINSILMSFQLHDIENEEIVIKDYFTFIHFKNAFVEFVTDADLTNGLSITLKAFAVTTIIGTPLGILFAFYIYKKLPFWGGFRVILFLPSILSAVIVTQIFRYYLVECVPKILPSVGNLLDSTREEAHFPVLMFYCIWAGFGTSVLMYSNKMAGIADEIIESAHLDGATGIKEFWYIVLPLTYSTISVFLITGVAQIFVNQYGAYDMFVENTPRNVKSIGWWFFVNVQGKFSDLTSTDGAAQLPYYSAVGVVLTLITVPIALGVRWALERFGPSED